MVDVQEAYKNLCAQLGEVLLSKESAVKQLSQVKAKELELRLSIAELKGTHAERERIKNEPSKDSSAQV